MTINEMRSAVCKKANYLMRVYRDTRSAAFVKAWEIVKREARMVKASDLKDGDVINVEFGDDNHFVICTVVSKFTANGKYWTIKIRYRDGRELWMCTNSIDEKIEKVA